jgi:hypothetical protein
MAAEVNSITEAREKLSRFRSQLANMREEAKHVAKVGTSAVLTITGGGLAGAIQSKMPYLPGTQVPTAAALGFGLIALAMSGMLDDQADAAADVGAGMLAALAAREAERIVSKAA